MKPFLLLAAVLLASQANTELEITAEPCHHLVFENKYVRIFNVEVPPHNGTRMHWHRHDYAYLILGAAHVSNEVEGKSPAEIHLSDGYAGFSPATFAHIAKNLSDQTFHNIAIEYLQDATLRQNEKANTAKLDATRGLDILHGGTAEILFVNDGVRATKFELQPNVTVPPRKTSRPILLVAVSELNLSTSNPHTHTHQSPATKAQHLNPGEARWLQPGFTQPITNAGPNNAKFLTLEFP